MITSWMSYHDRKTTLFTQNTMRKCIIASTKSNSPTNQKNAPKNAKIMRNIALQLCESCGQILANLLVTLSKNKQIQ